MNVEFVHKLALGTAQFGLDYGLNNTTGRPNDATVRAILQEAASQGVTLLDTAAAYGDSEARLGHLLEASSGQFQLVTKLAAGSPAEVNLQIQASLQRLHLKQVYGILFHSFDGLKQHPEAWSALVEARQAGLTTRIGVSLYHPVQARWLLDSGLNLTLVQLPFNVLDQRFAPLLAELRKRGIEVHARSAFLQGLLLRDLGSLPSFFEPLRPKLARLQALAREAGVPLPALLLQFVAQTPAVDRVVIGVDSAENLRVNVAARAYAEQARELRPQLVRLAETDEQFILPYTWPPTR
ncbi:aldo/keto reductase [Hymenobacter sp. B81]|uniref:aldo/keto reductase n=1 Tax=Hymenobacter sp. B81 TaxID=3344878 RepID=UPI0037DD2ABF